LKGTSASIGAEGVRAAAMNLEAMARAGDLQSVLSLNDKLIKLKTPPAYTEVIPAVINSRGVSKNIFVLFISLFLKW
jgi:hypothetical protein